MAVETATVATSLPHVADEAPEETLSTSLSHVSVADESPAETISTLRRTVEVKESELESLQMRIKTSKGGRASVRLAASRFMQKAEEDVVKKPSSSPEMPAVRSAAVSSLLSRWNAGIEKEVEKTKVDVKGDVRGTSGKFNNKDQSIARPNATEISSRRARGPTGPAELEVEDDEKVPSWAVNQNRKVVKKVNARASVRDVDVSKLNRKISTRRTDVDTTSVRETPVQASNGGVAAALAKWGKMADEEAEKLERVNVVEQARRDAEKKKKEHEAEQLKIKEEAEALARAEREKIEAAERAAREKKEAELKAQRLAEQRQQAKKAREDEIRMLREMPENEPVAANSSDLIVWLTNRIKLLDILIGEAETELGELEKNL